MYIREAIDQRAAGCASSATACIRASRLGKCRNGAPGETPTRRAAYRGAGKPEANDLIERLIDLSAAKLAMDALKLR